MSDWYDSIEPNRLEEWDDYVVVDPESCFLTRTRHPRSYGVTSGISRRSASYGEGERLDVELGVRFF